MSSNRRFKALHERNPPPYQPVSLNKYRAVFVTDRLEHPDRPGPSNEGAAIIMGNSVQRWYDSYWPRRRHTLSRKAVADMAAYRQDLHDASEDDLSA